MDQSKLLNVLRRYWWLFLVALVIASITAYFVLNQQPVLYETKTQLLVGPTVDSPSPDLNALRIGSQMMQTYADLVTTRPLLEAINSKLEQKTSVERLAGMMDIKQNPDARILTIIVRSNDPKQAVAIANAAANSLIELSPSKDNTTALVREQMSNQVHQLETITTNAEASIQELQQQLVALGSVQPRTPEETQAALDQQTLITQQLSEERARLSDALRTLATVYQVLQDTNTNQLEIVEPAGAVFPINQNLPLRVAATGLAALLLIIAVVFAYEYYDDTIRVPGDFTRTVNVPLLTTVEKYPRSGSSGLEKVVTFSQPRSEVADDYRTAVAKLLYSIGNSMPCSYLLSSVGSKSGDDTALAAANLGVAFAQSGYRVILVDAQFHNPMLTELFEADGKKGLYELLTTKTSELNLVPVSGMADLSFLPAGLTTENWSGAMLNSTNIVKRVEELQNAADIVLFAGPSASGFAESLTLASQVKGVILVARSGEAHRKVINEVADSLADMNIQLAGAIFEENSTTIKSVFKRSSATRGASTRVANSQITPTTTGPVEKTNLP